MKILFVHERFGAMGGAEVNAFLTATELKSRGHQVAILHGAGTGKNEAGWREVFSPAFPLPEGQAGRQSHDSATTTQAALHEFRPDAIYVHKLADLAVIEALVRSGCPLVRMVHDHDLYCLRSYKYNPLTRKICTRAATPYCIFPCGGTLQRNRGGGLPFKLLSYGDKIKEIKLNRQFQRLIVASEYMREELLRNGFAGEKIEIHEPVPRTLADAPRATFGERNLIVYSGQIIRGKGVDVLLESLAQVRAPFECLILGDGGHKNFCEELSRKLGLANRVHFKGFLPQDELRGYYAEASLGVMSSVWPEPFGAAGLEAMRHGLPVVAFDAGGIKEWLHDGENGLLALWMDRAGFAARVEKLLADKALGRKLGENGRRMVLEKYNFPRYIQNLETMFARVVAENDNRQMP